MKKQTIENKKEAVTLALNEDTLRYVVGLLDEIKLWKKLNVDSAEEISQLEDRLRKQNIKVRKLRAGIKEALRIISDPANEKKMWITDVENALLENK